MIQDKINVAELLKDCPKGMELDCTMFENVTFVRVDMNKRQFPIEIAVSGVRSKYLSKEGCFHDTTLSPESKCVIFPKGKTTWDGFVPPCPFKDGDILYAIDEGNEYIFIFKEVYENERVYCHLNLKGNNLRIQEVWITDYNPTTHRLATEEEKQKLFDAIKDHGYKWNTKTKTLEMLTELTEPKEEVDDKIVMSGIYFDRENYADEVELHLGNYEIEIRDGKTYAIFKNQETKTLKPKFKVGDRIKYKNGKDIHGVEQGVILSITDGTYDVAVTNNMGIFVPITDQDKWELIELKFKVGDRIRNKNYKDYIYDIHDIIDKGYRAKEIDADSPILILFGSQEDNYELVPNKFDINTLVPYESRVLVRNADGDLWKPAIYGFSHSKGCYVVGGVYWRQCIPYESNKELLGTTNNLE
jgi:co-chaperonin GroES (HSP10)